MTEKQMFEEMLQKQGLEIRKLRSELRKAQHEAKERKTRIDKAIEFIKNKQELNKMFGTITLQKDSQNELLHILQGDDK